MENGRYIDEKILQLRQCYRTHLKELDLSTADVKICGKNIRFVPSSIFDGKVIVWIPETFIEMPMAIAKVRYNSIYRPPIIVTSELYSENFGYHLLEKKMLNLDQAAMQMKEAVLLHAPETVIYDKGDIEADSIWGKWFEYKNFTLNDETYNLQFLIQANQYLLIGTFNCRMKDFDEWKIPVLQALSYTKVDESED